MLSVQMQGDLYQEAFEFAMCFTGIGPLAPVLSQSLALAGICLLTQLLMSYPYNCSWLCKKQKSNCQNRQLHDS